MGKDRLRHWWAEVDHKFWEWEGVLQTLPSLCTYSAHAITFVCSTAEHHPTASMFWPCPYVCLSLVATAC